MDGPQVVMLQKALAASGASPEEIAAILGKAAGNGLDDDEISSIMSAVMGNSDLSKEDVENMMNLQKSLKTGGFRKAGVTPEVTNITGCSIRWRRWVWLTWIWHVPPSLPSCLAARPYLPKSHLPSQGRKWNT